MNIINNYKDFLNEKSLISNEEDLKLLLEANMVFNDGIIKLLNTIESPLAKNILELDNKTIDVNTNYISYNSDKDDKILFKPDDKVEKLKNYFKVVTSVFSRILFENSKFITDKVNIAGEIYDNISSYEEVEVTIQDIDQKLVAELIEVSGHYSKASLIDSLVDNPVVLISWKDSNFDRTYTTITKKNYIYKNTSEVKDSEISVGRFVRALLKKAKVEFKDKDIEKFVTDYKTYMRVLRNDFDRIDEVKGEDIKKWYLHTNYFGKSEQGSLGSSCMRYEHTQKYLDIYTDNPNQVSLIIMYSDEEKELICARALLWDNGKDKLMDRVYTYDSSHESFFKEYAISKGYCYRDPSTEYLVDAKGDDLYDFTVELEKTEFYYYPYMDTMINYNVNNGVLSSESSYDSIELQSTEGGPRCDYCNNTGTRSCRVCDGDTDVECNECEGRGDNDCGICDGESYHECSECYGSGKEEDDEGEEIDCTSCNGEGKTECENCDGSGKFTCDDCSGEGRYECYECEGSGETECDECEY